MHREIVFRPPNITGREARDVLYQAKLKKNSKPAMTRDIDRRHRRLAVAKAPRNSRLIGYRPRHRRRLAQLKALA